MQTLNRNYLIGLAFWGSAATLASTLWVEYGTWKADGDLLGVVRDAPVTGTPVDTSQPAAPPTAADFAEPLFGLPGPAQPAAATSGESLPPPADEASLPVSSLPIVLYGIVYSPVDGQARAIVGSSPEQQSTVHVGDVLADGAAVVHAIRRDLVLVRRDGQTERLSLPRYDDGITSDTNNPAPAIVIPGLQMPPDVPPPAG